MIEHLQDKEPCPTETSKILKALGICSKDIKYDANLYSYITNTLVKGFVRLTNENALNAARLIKDHLKEDLLVSLKKNIESYNQIQDIDYSKREHMIRGSLGDDTKSIF